MVLLHSFLIWIGAWESRTDDIAWLICFAKRSGSSQSILEIACARSPWKSHMLMFRIFLKLHTCWSDVGLVTASDARTRKWNSLLVNLPACSLQKLQRVLNTAARIVSLRPKRDDIIPVLISLHCLPIEHRIHYKVILLVFRCLHNLAPSYLSELLKLYAPERENLRSSDKLFLDYSIPSTKYGERAFSVSGSVLWNSLPDNIRLLDDIGSFKSKLKTWLFKDAYKKHLWQLLLWQLPLVVLSGSLRLLLLTAFVCYVHVLAKWCVFTCVSFPFITYIIYNPFYASIFFNLHGLYLFMF